MCTVFFFIVFPFLVGLVDNKGDGKEPTCQLCYFHQSTRPLTDSFSHSFLHGNFQRYGAVQRTGVVTTPCNWALFCGKVYFLFCAAFSCMQYFLLSLKREIRCWSSKSQAETEWWDTARLMLLVWSFRPLSANTTFIDHLRLQSQFQKIEIEMGSECNWRFCPVLIVSKWLQFSRNDTCRFSKTQNDLQPDKVRKVVLWKQFLFPN